MKPGRQRRMAGRRANVVATKLTTGLSSWEHLQIEPTTLHDYAFHSDAANVPSCRSAGAGAGQLPSGPVNAG
jgi:hypothetical protein